MLNSALIALCFFLYASETQSRTLHLDVERSAITFSVNHMGFLTVDGSFSAFDASMLISNKQPVQVVGHIEVSSIGTDEPTRDKSLRDEGYLDVARFPRITFSSTSILEDDDGYTIIGKLQIKDEVRTISIPGQIEVLPDNSSELTSEMIFSRKAFNLEFGAMDALIGDEITIHINLRFQ